MAYEDEQGIDGEIVDEEGQIKKKIKKGTKKIVDRQIKEIAADLGSIFSKTIDEAIDMIKKYKLPLLILGGGYLIYRYFFEERNDDY